MSNDSKSIEVKKKNDNVINMDSWEKAQSDAFDAWENKQDRKKAFEEKEAEDREYSFMSVSEMVQHIKPIDWLVKGYLEADSLALLYGEPGCAKSFLAIDWACCIATGTDWHGHHTKQGSVFYIAGEGYNGLARRFRAWSEANNVEFDPKALFCSTVPARICDAEHAKEVHHAVEALADKTKTRPSLIIVDTLARNFGPGNENGTEDMGAFVSHVDRYLRRFLGNCTALIVHHSGKNEALGPRGNTALRGSVDAEYHLKSDSEGMRNLKSTKMKDAEEPPALAFTLEKQDLPFADEDGKPVNSAVLKPAKYTEPEKLEASKAGRGKTQQYALDVLRTLYGEHRATLEASKNDPGTARVLVNDWSNACKELNKNQFYKVKGSLLDRGDIKIEAGYVIPAHKYYDVSV